MASPASPEDISARRSKTFNSKPMPLVGYKIFSLYNIFKKLHKYQIFD
jgi:hypothetical protein